MNAKRARLFIRKLEKDKHEVRDVYAVCMNSNIKTYKRRVSKNLGKPCFETGTYKPLKDASGGARIFLLVFRLLTKRDDS